MGAEVRGWEKPGTDPFQICLSWDWETASGWGCEAGPAAGAGQGIEEKKIQAALPLPTGLTLLGLWVT